MDDQSPCVHTGSKVGGGYCCKKFVVSVSESFPFIVIGNLFDVTSLTPRDSRCSLAESRPSNVYFLSMRKVQPKVQSSLQREKRTFVVLELRLFTS